MSCATADDHLFCGVLAPAASTRPPHSRLGKPGLTRSGQTDRAAARTAQHSPGSGPLTQHLRSLHGGITQPRGSSRQPSFREKDPDHDQILAQSRRDQ
jgi:hypothetical protein